MASISPEQWQALSPYLEQALEMGEPQRAAWLASLRASDPTLADRLQALLDERDALASEGFLEQGPALQPPEAGLAGRVIGAYHLLSRVGEGGMGSVWLAERVDGRFERKVALKFLNLALAGRGGEERFRREGRILGRLTHPHIAELLDAGVYDEGQPYLVLEHVEGEPIDRYCDRLELAFDARVRLFLDVLAAVAHAHANLVVHRDLKPSNVLVRNDGQVKLLDFGIAKLLEDQGDAAAATMLTQQAGNALTPAYAAPEQVTGGPVTTATDVYSLGVLLYLLLTGQHPAGTAATRSAADLIKAIVETEPARPSDAVAQAGRPQQDAAAARATTPEKLRRSLQGDLDTIATKALKKNPHERYASVTAFADDLSRTLRHEPIGARPDTLSYRAAKFIRRNRTAVALAAVAVVATIAGVAGTLMQARTARAQRDFALRQLSRAQAVSDLDQYVLSDAAPSGKRFTVGDLLAGAEHIVRRQQSDEATTVQLLISIGQQHTVQEEYTQARRLLEEAYTRSRALPDPSIRAMASCAFADTLSRLGDSARADALFHQGLDELPDDPMFVVQRVFCLLRGSGIAEESGAVREGVIRAQTGARVAQQSPFHSDSLELDALITLAGAYDLADQLEEADAAFRDAMARLSALGRDDTEQAILVLNNWAIVLLRGGRPLDAERLFRRCIDIARDGPGEESVKPMHLANYANALYQIGELARATDYAERAFVRAVKAGDPVAIHQLLLLRARIYRSLNRLADSEAMLADLEARLQRLPPGHIAFAALAAERALNAQVRGDLLTAIDLSDRAVAIADAQARTGGGSLDYEGKFLARRSTIALDLGRADQAVADATQAVDLLRKSSMPGFVSNNLGFAYLALGRGLQAQGKVEQARAAFSSAGWNLEGSVGPNHPDTRAARRLAGPDNRRP